MKNWILALCSLVLFATAGSAEARERGLLTVSAGVFDLVMHHRQDAELEVQYRFAYNFLATEDGAFRGFHPLVGGFVNTASGAMAFAGFAAPFSFADNHWEITPSGAVGAYNHGNSLDLGGIFEFRLGLAASYRLTRFTRLGVELEHISNANINRKNPGTNNALLTFSWIIDGY
jgi:hypothetical protein